MLMTPEKTPTLTKAPRHEASAWASSDFFAGLIHCTPSEAPESGPDQVRGSRARPAVDTASRFRSSGRPLACASPNSEDPAQARDKGITRLLQVHQQHA